MKDYKATHASVNDGSTVMLIEEHPTFLVVENECGDRWVDSAETWQKIPTPGADFLALLQDEAEYPGMFHRRLKAWVGDDSETARVLRDFDKRGQA